MSRLTRPALIVGTALALSAPAAVATAAIPSANGTVHTCVSTLLGTVRVVDTDKGQACSPFFEKSLDINQQGQKGDTGAPGAPGKDGAPGAQGQKGDTGAPGGGGKAFEKRFPGGNLPKLTDTNPQVVSTKQVPAGKYIVWAKGDAFSIEGSWSVTCELFEDGASIDRSSVDGESGEDGSYVLMSSATAGGTSPHTLEVRCNANEDGANATFIFRPELVAMQVDSVG